LKKLFETVKFNNAPEASVMLPDGQHRLYGRVVQYDAKSVTIVGMMNEKYKIATGDRE